MSGQLKLWDDGAGGSENGLNAVESRARLARELRYLLAISTEAGRVGRLSPSGLAHSLGVCLIEDFHMSRGKGKSGGEGASASMPRFVDIKLTEAERKAFPGYSEFDRDPVRHMQAFADKGYRIGVTWSGEHQTYTVSLTCRNPDDPNNGLCMTSFAREIGTAVMLCVYKHYAIAHEVWSSVAPKPDELFG